MFTLSLLALLFVVPLIAGMGAGAWTLRAGNRSTSSRSSSH
jgi:hypothetical protein